MKFLGDENLDFQIVERLRLDSHIVFYVVEMEPGIYDDEVLDLANNEGAMLLTSDKDFGESNTFLNNVLWVNPKSARCCR